MCKCSYLLPLYSYDWVLLVDSVVNYHQFFLSADFVLRFNSMVSLWSVLWFDFMVSLRSVLIPLYLYVVCCGDLLVGAVVGLLSYCYDGVFSVDSAVN